MPEVELENISHYLPHRQVIKAGNSSTRIRPVFDVSARENNFPSLNQCLETGPNLIELITSILLKFREQNIGAIADIKRAFLQISINHRERDYLRFLWSHDESIIKFCHRRVVFGVTCSPFLLGATIELHLNNVAKGVADVTASERILRKIKESFYSDNCVASFNSMEELLLFKENSTRILKAANFELRHWKYTGDGCIGTTTVLGTVWDKSEDTLKVNLSFLKELKQDRFTKRMMLSVIQRVFDHIGFTCPVMLCPERLLQKTWSNKVDWDDEIDAATRIKFLQWLQDLLILEKVKIPRKLGIVKDESHVSLYTFADASSQAYAAAVFVCVETGPDIEVQLIGAKARIVPSKGMIIPRLELLAAAIAARL